MSLTPDIDLLKVVKSLPLNKDILRGLKDNVINQYVKDKSQLIQLSYYQELHNYLLKNNNHVNVELIMALIYAMCNIQNNPIMPIIDTNSGAWKKFYRRQSIVIKKGPVYWRNKQNALSNKIGRCISIIRTQNKELYTASIRLNVVTKLLKKAIEDREEDEKTTHEVNVIEHNSHIAKCALREAKKRKLEVIDKDEEKNAFFTDDESDDESDTELKSHHSEFHNSVPLNLHSINSHASSSDPTTPTTGLQQQMSDLTANE